MQWGHSFVERAAELHPREKVIWRRLLYFLKGDGRSGTATTSFYWRLCCVFYSCMQKKKEKCQNPLPPWLSLDHDDMIHTQ